jgi:hypothetical protein
MISCREIAKLVTSDEVLSLGWTKRVQVKVHLLMCRYCSRLLRQIELIRRTARELRVETGTPPRAPEGSTLESRVLARLATPRGQSGLRVGDPQRPNR